MGPTLYLSVQGGGIMSESTEKDVYFVQISAGPGDGPTLDIYGLTAEGVVYFYFNPFILAERSHTGQSQWDG